MFPSPSGLAPSSSQWLSGSGQTATLSGMGFSFTFRPGSERQPVASGSGQTAALSGMGFSFTFRLGSEGQPVAFRIRSHRRTEWERCFLHLPAWLPAGLAFMPGSLHSSSMLTSSWSKTQCTHLQRTETPKVEGCNRSAMLIKRPIKSSSWYVHQKRAFPQ